MTYRSIKDWPEDERPRERLLKHGAGSLSEAQLLAIILRTGGCGKSAIDIAMELLAGVGSLRKLEQAGIAEICRTKGMGRAKAAQLKAALEIARRLNREQPGSAPAFSTGKEVFCYLQPLMSGLKKETFYCLMLDVKNRLIKEMRISEGTLSSSLIHPREAFTNAVRESAASVIFAHNHPSGDPTPSRDDIEITGRLEKAGEMLGIKLLDHIIVGDGQYTSMLEKGYLKCG